MSTRLAGLMLPARTAATASGARRRHSQTTEGATI